MLGLLPGMRDKSNVAWIFLSQYVNKHKQRRGRGRRWSVKRRGKKTETPPAPKEEKTLQRMRRTRNKKTNESWEPRRATRLAYVRLTREEEA